jgi:hypothetical protein
VGIFKPHKLLGEEQYRMVDDNGMKLIAIKRRTLIVAIIAVTLTIATMGGM